MKFVIDTNIFWVSISRRSPSHWLFRALLDGKYTLCLTTEILNEYEEIMGQKLGSEIADAVMETLENLPNIEYITRYYRWNLIKSDPDDNPFVDVAIASNAYAVVTFDRHFNILKRTPFPKVNVITLDDFMAILKEI